MIYTNSKFREEFTSAPSVKCIHLSNLRKKKAYNLLNFLYYTINFTSYIIRNT
jgi:hypothetical protein